MHVLAGGDKTAAKKEKSILDQACTALLANADCEQVVSSAWGSIPIGKTFIPTALLGLDYFIFLFCWFLLVGQVPPSRLWAHLMVACLSAAGVGMSIFLLYQMSRLPHPCSLCMLTHVANFLLFGCVLLLWPRKSSVTMLAEAPLTTIENSTGGALFAPATTPTPVNADAPWYMLVVTLLMAVLAIVAATLSLKVQAQAPSAVDQKLKSAEQVRDYYKKMFERYDNKWEHLFLAWKLCPTLTQSTDHAPTRGPDNARHTVIVYSDFQCPTCREFEKMFNEKILPLSAKYDGLKVVFKNWPICTDCNPKASRNLHPAACKAALAAEAAFLIGGNDAFWRMHDMLFATQDQWKESMQFEGYAKQIGLDVKQFVDAMNSEETLQRVKADIMEGTNLGKDLLSDKFKEEDQQAVIVDSTPSVYIDHKKIPRWNNPRTWQEIMRQTASAPAAP
jgi:uncharacterized membrane protein